MKPTLLSFEVVPSHGYAPLRTAVHVLETFRKVFFRDGVQDPRHVPLDVRNILKSLTFQSDFEAWEEKEIWRIQIQISCNALLQRMRAGV